MRVTDIKKNIAFIFKFAFTEFGKLYKCTQTLTNNFLSFNDK